MMHSESACAICLDDVAADGLFFHTHACRCHRDCLATWMETNPCCPMCRAPMPPDSAVLLSGPESEVLEEYYESLALMRAAEQRLTLAKAVATASATTSGEGPDHLAEKSEIMSMLTVMYRAHEDVYDALESKIRRIRKDASADLQYLGGVYLDRIFAESGANHVSVVGSL